MSARPRGTDRAEVISVIKTEALVGAGEEMKDPCRLVTQYWSLDGEKLAVDDDWAAEREDRARRALQPVITGQAPDGDDLTEGEMVRLARQRWHDG